MSNGYLDERGLVSSCPECGQLNRQNYAALGRQFRCGKCHRDLAAVDEPIELPTERIFEALVGSSTLPVLVDFWAPWCGPCKMVAPELVKVAASGASRWLVVKANTEQLPGAAARFGIQAIPTMVLFQGGREAGRQSGAMPAPGILQFLERFNIARRAAAA